MKNNAVIYELITESQGDLADKMREVFDRGFEQGLKDNSEEAYQKGLDEAWDAARKIASMSDSEQFDVFNEYGNANVFGYNSASEAIEKIKAYEEQKKAEEEEIKVGDEVKFNGGKGVAIDILGKDKMYILNDNGCIERIDIRLTQIAEVLKQLQEVEK